MTLELWPVSADHSRGRPHRLGAEYDHRTNFLSLARVRELPSIAVHEAMHFFEHCSTPYGVFQDEANQRTLDLTQKFLQQHSGQIYTPIDQWVRLFLRDAGACPGITGPEHFQRLIQITIKPWSAIMHCWEVMEGYNYQTVLAARADEMSDLLVDFFRNDTSGERTLARELTLAADQACPSVQREGTGDKSLPIGAIHVSETMAHLR